LTEFLTTNLITKDLVWRLSKWCDWSYEKSKDIAISIANELFYGVICRRLRDQKNNPIPNKVFANDDYQNWIDTMVSISKDKIQETVYPDQVGDEYYEGARHSVKVNAYERNKAARRKCIDHYGAKCIICGFSFDETYDGIGEGFIHVHHIVPLSKINKEYKVDPINDLRPICPNCHTVIHRFKEPYNIEDVKKMLKEK
jgi:predicted HNH restriction endonuclease